ncbi:MAG: molybdopterin-dependent oxidoreductase [Actinomycetes bacterium]
MKKIISGSLLVALAGLVLTGCGATSKSAQSSPSPTPVSASASPSNPYGAAPIDPPATTDPILELSKGGFDSKYTMAQLISLGTTEISIYEPFVKLQQSFTVIPLSKLFSVAGILGTDKVITKALNDYVYTNTANSFLTAKGYLALKRNGTDIPYDQGGPVRIVFPSDSTWAKFLDPWNWSLSSISVK